MRHSRFQLVKTECRRCGRPLYSGSRSLYGADEAKARLDRICEGCTTEEERREMLCEQAKAIMKGG